MSVGRNDLCPCGSGKKYKKCCGIVTPITELRSRHEQKLQKEYAAWVERLNHFVAGQVSSETVQKARERFAVEVGLSDESVMQPEWAAHFFNWFVLDVKTTGETVLESYLKQHGRRMDPDLRRSFTRLHLNAYEIVQVERDVLTVRHPLSGETRYVLRTSPLNMQPGQIIVGRLLNLGLRDLLFSGSIILQPHVKPALVEWLGEHPEVAEAAADSGKRTYTTSLYRFIVAFGESEGGSRSAGLTRRIYAIPDMDRLRQAIDSQRAFELKKREGSREIWVYAPRKEEHLFPALKDALLELYEVQAEVILQDKTAWVEGYPAQLDEVASLLQLPGEAAEEEIRVLTSTGSKLAKGTLFVTSEPMLPSNVLQWAMRAYFTEKWLVTPHEALDGLAPTLAAASASEPLQHKLRELIDHLERDGQSGQGLARLIHLDTLKPRLALPNDTLHVANLLSRPLIEGLPESVYTVQPERLADINRFVVEMTEGKSEATVKKYDEAMSNFRTFVRSAFGPSFSWEQLRQEDVAYFLVHDIFTRVDAATKTLAGNLLSVLMAFFKWLDKQYGTAIAAAMQPLFGELKEALPEAYRLRGLLEKEAHQHLFGADGPKQVAEEHLVLIGRETDGWLAKRPGGETIRLSLAAEAADALAPHWTIAGLIGQTKDGTWCLYGTPELYPPAVSQLLGVTTSVPV